MSDDSNVTRLLRHLHLWQLLGQDTESGSPASKTAVDNLPGIKPAQSKSKECAVCWKDFDTDSAIKSMPCRHEFHTDCLRPWLEQKNCCPLCRHKLPPDDETYQIYMRLEKERAAKERFLRRSRST